MRLVESAAASDRLDAARAFIESHPRDRELLIIGASRGAADDLARLIAARRGATFGLRRYSFVQLAAVLALTRAGPDTAPTTRLGSAAIAARVSYQALQDGALNYYAPVVQFPGFPGALASTVGELRLAGISPGAIEPAAQGDVSGLLRRFEDQFADGRVHDLAALLRAAAEVASEDPPHPLLQNPLVLLDIAVESPEHQAFVASLLRRAPSALITLPNGDEPSRRAFSALLPPSESTDTAAPHAAPPSSRDELGRLRTYLFSPESPPQKERRGQVVLFSAPGEGRGLPLVGRLLG